MRPGFHGSGRGVKLRKNPNDLFTVWKEWEFGMNGTKPAKDFTSHKRGASSLIVDVRCFGMLLID